MTNNNDQLYMRRALQLANLGAGYNAPNPRVGAVIVHQDRVIGEGWHERYGEAHAEVNAVASVREEDRHLLTQSTIYVTLEPCFHYGKTPPCVDLILKYKIPRVVVACIDSFDKVSGKSIAKLKAAGVETRVGVLESEGLHTTRRFFKSIHAQRPYVVLKFAQSADGFIGRAGEEVAISTKISKRLVHRWRSEEPAILVGTNTALVDNPKLDNRHYFGRSPLRLVIDRELKIPATHHLLDGQHTTWVFTEREEHPDLPNVRFIPINFNENIVPQILKALQEGKIQSVLVEGGRVLLQSFLDAGLWDECRVLTNRKKLNEGIAAPKLDESLLRESQQIGEDILKTYMR